MRAALKKGVGGSDCFHSPLDILNMFFEGIGGGRKCERRSKNLLQQIGVTLEELHNGAVHNGFGGKKGGSVDKCLTCRGSEMKAHVQRLAPDFIQ